MRRREFIAGVGATAFPVGTRAQQATPLVGVLTSLRSDDQALRTPWLAKGLDEQGFIEGRNVSLEYRYADGQFDRLPALADDVVRRRPAVIAAVSPPAALAAKAATSTIPVVFMVGLDPIRIGLVSSLNRPEGNLTGSYILIQDLGAKRLGLLRQVVPGGGLFGALLHASAPDVATQADELQAAAGTLGQDILAIGATTDDEIEAAFATFAERRTAALVVIGDVFFFTRRNQITALAARHRIPAIYHQRDFVEAGGLMSYATSIGDGFRQLGIYVGKILKGVKPTDLPVLQSSRVEFVINLKTAKELGLEFHPQLLATADEVIE